MVRLRASPPACVHIRSSARILCHTSLRQLRRLLTIYAAAVALTDDRLCVPALGLERSCLSSSTGC